MTATNEAGAADVVRSYCDAWVNADAIAVVAMYHRDLTLEWPGRHRLAGIHRGQHASIEALLELQAATNRLPMRIVDVLEGAHSVAAIVQEQWSRDGDDGASEVFDHQRVLEFTVKDQQLHTCRIYESAQRDVDEWIGQSPVS